MERNNKIKSREDLAVRVLKVYSLVLAHPILSTDSTNLTPLPLDLSLPKRGVFFGRV